MQDILNAHIEHREPFRPFAPAILEERTADYFERSFASPFIQLTYPVRQGPVTKTNESRTCARTPRCVPK
jgi:predicted NodU family carbamoyl transferase